MHLFPAQKISHSFGSFVFSSGRQPSRWIQRSQKALFFFLLRHLFAIFSLTYPRIEEDVSNSFQSGVSQRSFSFNVYGALHAQGGGSSPLDPWRPRQKWRFFQETKRST